MLQSLFRGILLCLVCLSCTDVTVDNGENQMGKLIAAQATTLTTTANPIGSFVGNRLQNLQQDELEPGEYTLQFQVIEPTVDGLGSATYAYIYWKVAGQQVSRIISVFNGTAISGVANSVHVQLLDQSGRDGTVVFVPNFNLTNGSANFTTTATVNLKAGQMIQFGSQPGIWYTVPYGISGVAGTLDRLFTGPTGASSAFAQSAYVVGVALSKGTRPSTMQPPVLLTQQTTVVNIGANSPIILPPDDAGVLSVLATATVNIGVQTEADNGVMGFSNAAGGPLSRYIVTKFPFWYPVPPGSVTAGFTNTSTTAALNFSIQWGIEG